MGSIKQSFLNYTVALGDLDTDGISIAANKIGTSLGFEFVDEAGNMPNLTHTALTAQASHKVDGVAPTISRLAITSTSQPYTVGEVIQVTVTFSEKVIVTGTPQLTSLKVGEQNKFATYKSGTDTPALVFEYTLVAEDTDTDGISIQAGQLDLNSGTIRDVVDNEATLTHGALTAQDSHRVDKIAPTVSSIAITSTTQPYSVGEVIQVTVTFSENMSVDTTQGTPQLTLKIGTADKSATYRSGAGTKKLNFQYTVVMGDVDTDGIEIEANPLTLNGGTITDIAGNNLDLTAFAGALPMRTSHTVKTTAPTIVRNGIGITSSANNSSYETGEMIQARVTFNENVTVTGTPQLTLKIGTTGKHANYASGGGTTKLIFEYRVTSEDRDADGISVNANQLALNDGTIKDIAGNAAILMHDPLPSQGAHKVRVDQLPSQQPGQPSEQPTVSSLYLTSTGPYRVGSSVEVTVYTSETITVTGNPTLTLTIGSTDRMARYTRGSGSSVLVFSYAVVAGDTDTDGVAVKANSLAGGTLKNSNSRDLVRTHSAITNAGTSHAVDTKSPTVRTSNGVAITSTSNNSTYKTGDTIEVTTRFSENVTVTGTPRLTLTIGTADKFANYTDGDGTTALNFQYTVTSGDTDADGISIGANTLKLNGGTITDTAGNPATLNHAALTTQASHKVGTTAPGPSGSGGVQPGAAVPTISSLALTSIGPYALNSNIEVTVYTTQKITVTGTPTLTLVIGTTEKTAQYASGSGSSALVFKYTVAADDSDTDGIAVKANYLALAGGTLKNSNGTDLVLTHSAIADAGTSHAVDSIVPTISGIAMSSTPSNNGTYTVGEKIQTTVTFTENVTVTGHTTVDVDDRRDSAERRLGKWHWHDGTRF